MLLLPCKADVAKMLGRSPEEVRIGIYTTIGDLFHSGHIAAIREARNFCDYLIVGIVNNPKKDRSWKNSPVQSLFERYIQIASCKYVDCVVPLEGEQDLYDSILLLQPDVRFVGEEYKDKDFTGKDIPGVELVYLARKHSFSSSDLRSRVYLAEKKKLLEDTKEGSDDNRN